MLDLCTGTADLAIAAATSRPAAPREVVGVDFAGEMLRVGAGEAARAPAWPIAIRLVRGDATRMPLADASVDAATIAFGIRNVARSRRGVRARCRRVLRPGGRLAILEFGMPTMPGLRRALSAGTSVTSCRASAGSSRSTRDAYAYLPASVAAVPVRRRVCRQFCDSAGFRDVARRPADPRHRLSVRRARD